MPFISEEIWHLLKERATPEESLVVAQWPESVAPDAEFLKAFARSTEVITSVRNIRKQNNIPNKEKLHLEVRGEDEREKEFHCLIEKLCNLESIDKVDELPAQAFTFVMGAAEYGVPFEGTVDTGEQAEKIKEELNYTKGFLKSVQKKLSNERFVSGAPEQVVANERKKEADAAAKIAVLEEQLKGMES